MKQRILSFFLAAIMLLALVAIPVYGAPTSGVSATKTSVSPGDSLTVSLTIPGTQTLISDMTLKIHFDKTQFEVTEVTAPDFSGTTKTQSTASEANNNGFFAAVYGSQSLDADVSIASGAVLSATLSVKADAVAGSYDFTLGNDFGVGSLDEYGLPDPVMTYADVGTKSVTVTIAAASPTYTVSFAANGGTGTMADVSGVSGDYVLPACGFTAPAGKQFKAWSVGGQEKAVGNTITVNANTTVTAVWEDIPAVQIASANVTVTAPVAGQNPSFTLASDAADQYTATVSSWYLNEEPYPSLGAQDVFEAGKYYSLRVVFTAQDGYEFTNSTVFTVNGQSTGSYGGIGQREAGFQLPAPTYTVSFAANGGTGTMAAVNNVSGSYTLPACTFTAPSGKQFKAWSVGGQEKAVGNTITVNADTTVTAVWEDIPHAHDLSLVPAKAATATEAGNIAYYTCSGCDKWFEDALGTVEITDKDSVIIPATGSTQPAFYSIPEGANAEWTKESGKDLLFVSNADYAKFVSVKVDDAAIDAEQYTAESGSTKVTLKSAYLEMQGEYPIRRMTSTLLPES